VSNVSLIMQYGPKFQNDVAICILNEVNVIFSCSRWKNQNNSTNENQLTIVKIQCSATSNHIQISISLSLAVARCSAEFCGAVWCLCGMNSVFFVRLCCRRKSEIVPSQSASLTVFCFEL
jgi:hypothetical protein